MPAESKSQQRLMGTVHAYQKGELDLSTLPASLAKKVKEMASEMKTKDVSDFAKTKHKGLPEKVKQEETTIEEAEKKQLSNVKVKHGKMHEVLGIKPDEDISSKYTSGKTLSDALTNKVGKEKALQMLNYAANMSNDSLFKSAVRELEEKKVLKEEVMEIYKVGDSVKLNDNTYQELINLYNTTNGTKGLNPEVLNDFVVKFPAYNGEYLRVSPKDENIKAIYNIQADKFEKASSVVSLTESEEKHVEKMKPVIIPKTNPSFKKLESKFGNKKQSFDETRVYPFKKIEFYQSGKLIPDMTQKFADSKQYLDLVKCIFGETTFRKVNNLLLEKKEKDLTIALLTEKLKRVTGKTFFLEAKYPTEFLNMVYNDICHIPPGILNKGFTAREWVDDSKRRRTWNRINDAYQTWVDATSSNRGETLPGRQPRYVNDWGLDRFMDRVTRLLLQLVREGKLSSSGERGSGTTQTYSLTFEGNVPKSKTGVTKVTTKDRFDEDAPVLPSTELPTVNPENDAKLKEKELRRLITKFQTEQDKLATQLKPFQEQIDLINQQIKILQGETPKQLMLYRGEIEKLMGELNKTMFVVNATVGKVVAQIDTRTGPVVPKYKNIVDGIKAFENFMENYKDLYEDLWEKNKGVASVNKSLSIKKEGLMFESKIGDFLNGILNMFKSLRNKFTRTINSAKQLELSLQNILA